jgi:hypothetical protein
LQNQNAAMQTNALFLVSGIHSLIPRRSAPLPPTR